MVKVINNSWSVTKIQVTGSETVPITGTAGLSSIASKDQYVYGATIRRIWYSAGPNGSWNIKRNGEIICVCKGSGHMFFAGSTLDVFPDKPLTFELLGNQNGILELELNKNSVSSSAVDSLPSGSESMATAITNGDVVVMSFLDTKFIGNGHLGSAFVKHSSNLTNSFNGTPFDLVTYTTPSPKYVRNIDGKFRMGAQNLIPNNEDIAQSGWTLSGTSTVNNSTFAETTSANSVHSISSTFNQTEGEEYVFEAEIKAFNRSWILMNLGTQASNSSGVYFNLQGLGAATSTFANTPKTQSIEYIGNDTYKCTISRVATSGLTGTISLLGAVADGNSSYTGNTACGYQINKLACRNLNANSSYIKTNDSYKFALPFEYSANGNLIGVLVEGARTNYIPSSTNPRSDNWSGQTYFTMTTKSSVFPGKSSFQFFNNDGLSSRGCSTIALALSMSTNYHLSAIIEETFGDSGIWDMGLYSNNAWNGLLRFTWSTKAFSSAAGTVTGMALNDLGTGPNGGRLFRVGGTITSSNAVNNHQVLFYPTGVAGSNSKQVILHQIQLENGSFRSSPILTSNSTVTRLSDFITLPINKFAYSNSAMTMAAEAYIPMAYSASFNMNVPLAVRSSSLYEANSGARLIFNPVSLSTGAAGGLNNVVLSNTALTIPGVNKIAGRFADINDLESVVVNGGTVSSANTLDWNGNGTTQLSIGHSQQVSNSQPLWGHLRTIVYLPYYESDDTKFKGLTS